MTSQPGKKTIVIHVLPNILRNKDNQAMKFGQWREYNIKKHFPGKTIHKIWWWNYSQTFFWKVKIEHISGSTVWIFMQFVLLDLQLDDYRNVLKLSWRPLAFTFYKGFLRNKKGLGLVSLPHLMYDFCRKTFVRKTIFY